MRSDKKRAGLRGPDGTASGTVICRVCRSIDGVDTSRVIERPVGHPLHRTSYPRTVCAACDAVGRTTLVTCRNNRAFGRSPRPVHCRYNANSSASISMPNSALINTRHADQLSGCLRNHAAKSCSSFIQSINESAPSRRLSMFIILRGSRVAAPRFSGVSFNRIRRVLCVGLID